MNWTFWKRKRPPLTEDQRAALRRLVSQAKYELIPLDSVLAKSGSLPEGAAVTVTGLDVGASRQRFGETIEVTGNGRLEQDGVLVCGVRGGADVAGGKLRRRLRLCAAGHQQHDK